MMVEAPSTPGHSVILCDWPFGQLGTAVPDVSPLNFLFSLHAGRVG